MTGGMDRITSTQNPYVKRIVAIRNDGLVRQQEGVFFLEGDRAIEEALNRGVTPVDLIYVPRMLDEEPAVIERAAKSGARIVSVSKDVYKKMADTMNPVWMAALYPLPNYTLAEVLSKPEGIYLIASNVQDPGNLGTIWRSSACLGATALMVSTPACDLWNGKVLRASSGATFAIPVLKARPQDIVAAFAAAGVLVYGADVKGQMLVTELPAKRPIAVAFGHETQGLHPDVARGLAGTFRIPMQSGMDSLNVASAAVVTLYELGRSNIAGK